MSSEIGIEVQLHNNRAFRSKNAIVFAAAVIAANVSLVVDGFSETPEKPKSLTTNVFSGTFEKCFRQSLVPVFKQKTGIDLNLLTAQPPVAKLQAEGDDPEIDVFIAGEPDIRSAYAFGVLAKMDQQLLPNLKGNYNSMLVDGTSAGVRFGATFVMSAQGLVYDADKWSAPPNSWFDLVSEKTPGIVNVRVPDSENTVAWMAIMANSLNGKWPTQVSDYAGVLKLIREKLAPRLGALLPSSGAMQASFVNDPRSTLTVGTDSVAAAMADRYGLNLKWAEPKEGAFQLPTLAAVTKTKHNYWAHVMINYLLDPEVQSRFAECGYYTPSNKNAKISDRVAPKMVHGEVAIENLMRMPWDTIKPIAPELDALFLQAVQSR
jgi:putative spermidine/putrescine transport system substrate-binding protein